MGISTGVNDPDGMKNQRYGGKIRRGEARVNEMPGEILRFVETY
jgi:hypothetical protein